MKPNIILKLHNQSFDAKIYSVIKDDQWRLLNRIEIWYNINPWIKTFNIFTTLLSQFFSLALHLIQIRSNQPTN